MLLEERVRPTQTLGARAEEDLCALQRGDRPRGVDAEALVLGAEDIATNVPSERCGRERRAAELFGHREQSLFPEIGRRVGARGERRLRDEVSPVAQLEVSAHRPGVKELEREQRVAFAACGCLGDGRVVERKRLAKQLGRAARVERRDLEAQAPGRLHHRCERRRVRRVGFDGLVANRRDDEHTERPRLAHEPRDVVVRPGWREMKVVHPEQDRSIRRDPFERALHHEPAKLGVVEREALAAGADLRAGGIRSQPLRGRGDPRRTVVVARRDVPEVHQHLLDDVAIGAFEPVELRHRADDAVERRGDLAVLRAKRRHEAALVRFLAQPLG